MLGHTTQGNHLEPRLSDYWDHPGKGNIVVERRELILNWFKAKKVFSSDVVGGLNNKMKVTMRKSYGFRTATATPIALYHALGKLTEPKPAHVGVSKTPHANTPRTEGEHRGFVYPFFVHTLRPLGLGAHTGNRDSRSFSEKILMHIGTGYFVQQQVAAGPPCG